VDEADLDCLLDDLEWLADDAEANPLAHIRWTPPQAEFLAMEQPVAMFRSGNQLGKTTVGIAKKLEFARAQKRTGETWIVCTSWSQSVSIMRKFHALCPVEWVDARRSSNFNERSGYGKDNPAVVTTWGWVFRFRTTNQGPEALQGATIDDVLIDEPTAQGIFRELERRVMRTGGRIDMTMTPANRDCTWQREMVEGGLIAEVHARLTVENLTPVGSSEPLRLLDGTLMDEDWIADQWRKTPALYAGVVLDGDWEMRFDGAILSAFDEDKNVMRLAKNHEVFSEGYWAVGIDYAAAPRDFGQVAALLRVRPWVDDKGHPREAVHQIDEVVMRGVTSNREFVRGRPHGLLTMLARHGLQWRDLDFAHGDNPVRAKYVIRSNIETMQVIARELGRTSHKSLSPRILSAKENQRSAGMVDTGVRYLNEAMADQFFTIDPRCVLTIDAIKTWDGTTTHPSKDRVDAIRYALKPWVFPRGSRSRARLIVA